MTTALVLGGAARVWKDVEAALDLGEYDLLIACNDASAAWPGHIDAAVTLHAEKMGLWMGRRRSAGYPMPAQVIGHEEASKSTLRLPDCLTGFTPYKLPGQQDSGSSGLFALKFALIDMGADKAVLCGVPMEDLGAHFFDLSAWGAAAAHRRGWKQALPAIQGRAKSMSGWTAEMLGQPTKEWLAA